MSRIPVLIVLTLPLLTLNACQQSSPAPSNEPPADAASQKSAPPAAGTTTTNKQDTPQATFATMVEAAKKNDVKTYLSCISEDLQNQEVGMVAYMLQRKAFYDRSARDKVVKIYEKHDLIDVDVEGLMQISGMSYRDGGERALHVVGDRVRDKQAFLDEAMNIEGISFSPMVPPGKLENVTVDGDTATGTITLPNGESEPIAFRRIASSWILGKPKELPPSPEREARQQFKASLQQQPTEQSQAISTIRRLGGTVDFDQHRSSRPVIKVKISGPQATDELLAQLKELTELKSINLQRASVRGPGFVHLKELKSLTDLDLSDSKIDDEGLEYLSELSQLRSVNLARTAVTDQGLSLLKGLSDLRELDIASTKVTGTGLLPLVDLRHLNKLRLGGTSASASVLTALRPLKRLRELEIDGGTDLKDDDLAPLGQLNSLRELTLHGLFVSDESLDHLRSMSRLRSLSIVDGINITGAGVQRLQEALPRCKIGQYGQSGK